MKKKRYICEAFKSGRCRKQNCDGAVPHIHYGTTGNFVSATCNELGTWTGCIIIKEPELNLAIPEEEFKI